jgi:hypothetical protein
LSIPQPAPRLLFHLFLLAMALLAPAARTDAAVTAQILANQLVVAGDGANNQIRVQVVDGNSARLEVVDQSGVLGTFARNTFTSIFVNGAGGNDTIDLNQARGAITEPATLNGGPGNDAIAGAAGATRIDGGTGDDRIVWLPGGGETDVEGGGGVDELDVNGSSFPETITLAPSAAGTRIAVSRDNTAILDVGTTEHIVVNTFGGNDQITASLGLATLTTLMLDGGDGDDILTGGDGGDVLIGSDGNDTIIPKQGGDQVFGGTGNDLIQWFPGDGTDGIDGQAGNDTLEFIGTNSNEQFQVLQNGTRVRLTRDLGSVEQDLVDVETTIIKSFGGDDIVTVGGSLLGLTHLNVDLGAGADTLFTNAASIVVANGGADSDRVVFNALGVQLVTSSATIDADGFTSLAYEGFENVTITNAVGTPPSLSITDPTTNPTLTLTTPFVSLAGTAADDIAVTAVTWASDRGASGTATGTTNWTIDNIPLQPGANKITVTAADAAGNKGTETFTVMTVTQIYTLAEGSTGAFFDTDILIANPNTVAAPVSITYLKGDGTTVDQTLTLAPTSRTTIAVDQLPGLEATEVSATVTSTTGVPIVVERTMRWDSTGYGAHTEKATDGPAQTWFFAEGSQGFFDTYVLLANPSPRENIATVTFLVEGSEAVVKKFTLAPTSRHTVPASTIPEVINRSFGIIVDFAAPGLAERAMYFGSPTFNAGHESAGVNRPATSWFLAEGATGSFFTTFVLLANPGKSDATATVTFLPEGGAAVTKTKLVPVGQRVTLNIAAEDPSLASGAVATAVQSTRPILVERAQYWPFTPDRWYEAHNSFGSTALGRKWGLAEGRVGGPEGYQTFILLANANQVDVAQVRITFLRTNGTTVIKTFTVNPASRLTVPVNSLAELNNESVGALIEVTGGAGIFVERAMYSNANGVMFAAGTNALATRLP